LPGLPGPAGLFALFALGIAAFCLLTWQVASAGRLVRPDGRLLRDFQRTAAAHPGYTTTAHYLCKLGNIQAAVPVLLAALVLAAWLGRRAALPRWWAPPAAAALAMGLLPVVVTTVKSAVDRPAPGRIHPDPHYGYFPSGHTATSAVGYGLAALVLSPFLRRTAARALLAAGTAVLLLAVGAALVWCDYHWPLDVVGSWCLTVTLLSAVAAAQRLPGATPAAVSRSSGSPGSDPRVKDRATSG
jgi:membrane-associated phospholipid phosphatase